MNTPHRPGRTGDFYARWKYPAFLLLGAAAVVLGTIGWMQSLPGTTLDSAVYLAVRLFALEFQLDGPPSIALNIARFLAAAVVYLTVASVVLDVLGKQLTVARASRARGHAVILGDGREAVPLAENYRWQKRGSGAVVVGEVSADAVAQLRRSRVAQIPALSDAALGRVLDRAARIVVTAATDDAAAELVHRVRKVRGGEHASSTTVLFTDRDLAGHWSRAGRETALCRPTQLAIALLRDIPPFVEHAMVPPPLVIGDGPVAAELARRIVTGWQQPGERVRVYCLGHNRGWVDTAAVGIEERADFVWVELQPHAGLAPRAVRAVIADWVGPDPLKFAVEGPRVYVAYPDGADTIPIATAVAEAVADVRVVALVDDVETWSDTLVHEPRPILVSSLALLADPATMELVPARLIEAELIADAGRWPADLTGVFGHVLHDDRRAARLVEQPLAVQAAVAAVAENVEPILAAGGIGLDRALPAAEPALVLSPDELAAIAGAIADVLQLAPGAAFDGSAEGRHRRVELAARLPVLAARAGLVPLRRSGAESPFTAETVQILALEAHNDYLRTSAVTGNATASVNAEKSWDELSEVDQRSNIAQVLDIPVKLGVLGLSWRSADTPTPYAFADADVERLAALEHRRWVHFQLRNGRARHTFNVSWEQLGAGVQEYDRGPARLLVQQLALLGLEIVKAGEE